LYGSLDHIIPPLFEIPDVFRSNNGYLAYDSRNKNVEPSEHEPYDEGAIEWEAAKNTNFIHVISCKRVVFSSDGLIIIGSD
jgi:hypothetical protein